MLLASRLALFSNAVLSTAPPTVRRTQPSQRRPLRAGTRVDRSHLGERWPSIQWLLSWHVCEGWRLGAAATSSAGAMRGASAAAVEKAAVARVWTVAPAAEGPALAARACQPRCCQEWAASLEATDAVEPTAAARSRNGGRSRSNHHQVRRFQTRRPAHRRRTNLRCPSRKFPRTE